MAGKKGADDGDGGEKELLLPLLTVDDVKQRLEKFLERHPDSTVSTLEIPGVGEFHRIDKPWGDPTLAIGLPNELDDIVEALNNLYLPERLSAFWHQDTKDIEILWTALPLADDQKEIVGRKFAFQFNSKKYQCEFGESSSRLKLLAGFTMPTTNPSSTNFRNMQSFTRMAHKHLRKSDNTEYTPLSFWIKKVRIGEKAAIKMIECLNFYLSYYDSSSPRVLIHDIHDPVSSKTRYIKGSFPALINSRSLDENLMSFWDATRQPNAMLKFIFYYRIIEYATSHYVDASVRAKLARVVSNPTITHNIEQSIESILSAFDGARADEVPRFNSLITSSVNPEIVWREIENNRLIFCERVVFDGGYTLSNIVSKDETLTTFASGGLIKFSTAIRNIRNVLVHGRDQSTATAITPTPRNMKYLSAWVNAIAAAAGEVVLYGHNA